MIRLSRLGRVLVGCEFAIAVAVVLYVGFSLARDVLAGSPPAIPAEIEGSCEPLIASATCQLSITRLNAGRYRIASDVPAARVTLVPGPRASVDHARTLLVRLAQPDALQLWIRDRSGEAAAAPIRLSAVGARTVTALPSTGQPIAALVLAPLPDVRAEPLVLDELGFFEKDQGLVNDSRPMFRWIPARIYYGTLIPRAVGRLCAFTVIAALIVPASILRRVNPILLSVLCCALCLLDLGILFSPYWAKDLRLFYASGPLLEGPGANLNTGLWQGFRLLNGEGLTFAPGSVTWERMPGYGLFCALAGALFGHDTLVDIAVATVLLQVLFYSVAVGIFSWAAGLLWKPAAVWTLGLLLAWLPKQLGYTQVDSIIGAIVLVLLATFCVRLKMVRDGHPVPVAMDLFVHLTFAVWFVMRPDVLPGWLIVSLVLHWRRFRRLLIPLTLVVLIGCSWGAYRARYTKEFVFATSSAGASLFCGLYEVPSRFPLSMICSDRSYFDWIRDHSRFDPRTRAANALAAREVIRFWLTYPGHFVIMIYHKMLICLAGDLWPGLPTDLQVAFFQIVPRPRVSLFFFAILALCAAAGYERYRTFLFLWPLFLDAPLFWVMFASLGRFYSAVGISVLVASVPPLFEREFYRALVARPWRAAAVIGGVCLLAISAWPVHDWLLRNDAFHYWTPFLDPARSRLDGLQ